MMDLNTIAHDARELARQEGLLTGPDQPLEDQEQAILKVSAMIGQRALQQELDSHKRRGYQGSSRVCGCGCDQKFVTYRSRRIVSRLGSVTLTRAYYHCRHCHQGFFPSDQEAGLGRHGVSVPLARAIVELTEAMAYRPSVKKLKVLLGIEISASTCLRVTDRVGSAADKSEQEGARKVKQNRHAVESKQTGRLYVLADGAMVHQVDGWHEAKALQCRWQAPDGSWHGHHLVRLEPAESFAAFAHASMHGCGLENARESVLVGDGGPWIWNHLGPIADEATQILDWYHAKEHLWSLARALYGEGTLRCQSYARELEGLLWESEHQELSGKLKADGKKVRAKGKREAFQGLIGYLASNACRMDYKRYRAMGLEIGSGAIEGDCKNLIHARMKRGSPRWSKAGCQHMLSLRSCYANDLRESLWTHKPLAA